MRIFSRWLPVDLLLIGLVSFVSPWAHSQAPESSPDPEKKTEGSTDPAGKETATGDNQGKEATKTKPEAESMQPLLPPKDQDLTPLVPPSDDLGGTLTPPPPGFQEATSDEIENAKASTTLVDFNGYLRVRGEIDKGLELGVHSKLNPDPYPQFPSPATGRSDTLAGANMRFRLEPTISISEEVHVMSQIDILDNLVLGSTPDGFPANGYTPFVVLSQGQNAPSSGYNSIMDSIVVKRVWGEVITPVGTLRFGRMPFHWGLGLLANDGGPYHQDRGPIVTQPQAYPREGHCFDCDYGTTVDRILFIAKIAGHEFIPMIDFTAEGPYFTHQFESGGQPIDFDQMDDVNSYMLAIQRRDKSEDIKAALERDDWSLNYGVYFTFRNQAFDAVDYNAPTDEAGNPLPGDAWSGAQQKKENFAVRNAEVYIPDVWVRFIWKKLRIELEATMMIGKLGYTNLHPNLNTTGELVWNNVEGRADILQFGGVLQGDYAFLNDQLIVGMEIGFASGDDSRGFGILNPQSQFCVTNACSPKDTTLNNFRFHPDYHVDLILWREVMGTVSDALYVRPSVQYNITEGLGTKVSAIYSSAIYSESTRGKSLPLGLEFDADFFYFSEDNFHVGFSYGILIPFAGMNDLGADEAPGGISGTINEDGDATIAHRFLGRLVLYF